MVFLRDLSGNLDAGTATKWGGNQITVIDNLFDNIDVSASIVNGTGKVRINTSWYFRSGKLEVRNPADTFSYLIAGSAIGANRTVTFPLLTANGNFVIDSFPNIFTALQVIRLEGSPDALDLHRTDNQVGDTVNIDFMLDDSADNGTTYARINSEITDNTDGSEDGKLEFSVREANSLIESMIIDSTGQVDILRNKLSITRDGSGELLDLYRTDNAVSNTADLNFYLQDSANNKTKYGSIQCEILDATNGSEDSIMSIGNIRNGTNLFSHQFHRDGNMNLRANINGSGTNFSELYFTAQDSASNTTDYSRINAKIIDDTNGSEDGALWFSNMRGGTMNYNMFLNGDGNLFIGRDDNNIRGVPSMISDTTNDVAFASSTAEYTLLSFTVKGNVVGVDGAVRLTVHGVLLQNQATGTTFTIRIKVGGTTVYQDDFGGTIAQSANEKVWMMQMMFYPSNQSTTNGKMHGFASMGDTATPTTGAGSIQDDETQVFAGFKANTFSWTQANDTTISVTCQMSVNNANVNIRMDSYYAEYLPS